MTPAGRAKTLLVPGKTYGRRAVPSHVAVGPRAALGVALLVGGLLLVGAGAAGYVDGKRCELTQTVAVAPAPNATGPVTPYAELPPSGQRVFASTLAAGAPTMTRRGAIDRGLVRYENATYRVTVHRRTGCAPRDPLAVEAPVGVGAAAFVAGVVLARGRRPD